MGLEPKHAKRLALSQSGWSAIFLSVALHGVPYCPVETLTPAAFAVRAMNVVDPFDPRNNLALGVGRGAAQAVVAALALGRHRLEALLGVPSPLPPLSA